MSRFIRESIFILVLTICGAVFSLSFGLAPPPWEEPDFELEAGEILVQDVRGLHLIWIDARSEAEYVAQRVPGAILLNESNWETGLANLMDVWLSNPMPIIVYCGSKQCGASKRIAAQLRETLPEAEVYSLHGGWEAWTK